MPSARPRPIEPGDEKADAVLRDLVGYNLKRAYITLRNDLVLALGDLGLRATTFSALAVVVAHPGMTQTQLASALGIERSGVVNLVDELESQGLIGRRPVPNNRRSYALHATTAGARLSGQALKKVRAREARLLGHMTAQQRDVLVGLLRAVEDAGSVGAA